ncbi:MAG: hypothetical protein VX278_22555 [Myxococcota bacterium]|nr:hypothetical protein [Myxococcota bacterium]
MSSAQPLHIHQENTRLRELLRQVEELCDLLDILWGSGKDQNGFWCELWSNDTTTLYRGDSLPTVLHQAIGYLKDLLS